MGRPRNIESPEKLWEYFQLYTDEIKGTPIRVLDFVGKDGNGVYREKERPLTIEGFEVWLFKNSIISDLGDYFSNKNGKYAEFSAICSHIRKTVRNDQIEGGMAGIYNPSITQRLNGLKEHSEESGTKEVIIKVKHERKGTGGDTPGTSFGADTDT